MVVERLDCKRPILWLASSEILTHPPHRPASVYFWCGGRTHSLVGEGDGGSIFWKTPDTALYSTYVSTLCSWFLICKIKDDFEFSSLLQHHDGVEEEDVSGSVPQSWAKFSKNNVEESQGNNFLVF
jgi:hypothetical protein